MSKNITDEILLESGFFRNKFRFLSNIYFFYRTGRILIKMIPPIIGRIPYKLEVAYDGILLFSTCVKFIDQFNTLMNLMDIDLVLKEGGTE